MRIVESVQIPKLLLRPQLHHSPWVFAKTFVEPVFALNVTRAVSEREDRRFVDFEGKLLSLNVIAVIDIGLFSH